MKRAVYFYQFLPSLQSSGVTEWMTGTAMGSSPQSTSGTKPGASTSRVESGCNCWKFQVLFDLSKREHYWCLWDSQVTCFNLWQGYVDYWPRLRKRKNELMKHSSEFSHKSARSWDRTLDRFMTADLEDCSSQRLVRKGWLWDWSGDEWQWLIY